MPGPPPTPRREDSGGLLGAFRSIWRAWRQRKVSLAVSLGVTALAAFLYVLTFIGERPTPAFEFIERLELNEIGRASCRERV